MQNKGTDYIRRLLKDKTRLKRWRKMILCLSCIVVFCTVYALILPAITLERKTVCGQEEHSHTEECYSSDGQLTCGKTEHTHTESCYADDKTSEDQSGEDSQQTPEQNQTEGQEQNSGQSQEQNQNQNQDQSQSQDQGQTSDDGNVAQNGENGDTAGTTADETAGNDEESVVAGSTSAPAAEGEDGTGSVTTTMEGFDLSADANKTNLKGVVLQYYDAKKWIDIQENVENKIPGDAKIKLTVQYQNVSIDQLLTKYNCKMTYDIPELLRNMTAGGKIFDSNNAVGTVTAQEGKIVVTFTRDYLEKLKADGDTVIAGDFYAEGDVKLSRLPDNGKTTLTTAGKNYTLDFGPDALAKYGKVTVDKQCVSKNKNVISRDDGNYLKYTITVTAGEDDCPEVSVVDTFTNNSSNVEYYAGITTTEKTLEGSENEVAPYETVTEGKTHGKIYKGNKTEDKTIPVVPTGTTEITEPGSMVWKIGDMAAGEVRTLTYFVKLKGKVNLKQAEIRNKADVFLKNYQRAYDEFSFTPKITYDMAKNRDSKYVNNIVKNSDGSYTINYKIEFSLDKDKSNFPLKNFELRDFLDYGDIYTNSELLANGYVYYNRDSVKLYAKKNTETAYSEVDGGNYDTLWSDKSDNYTSNWTKTTNPTRFKITGTSGNPITVNPGEGYYATYSITVKPEAMAYMKANSIDVKNRFLVAAENVENNYDYGIDRVYNQKTVGGYTWNQKMVGNVTTDAQTITMTGEKYNLTSGSITQDTSEDTTFTVPVGSYPYTVNVNETQGDWNATEVSMKDTLTPNDKMEYTGYVKVEAREYNPNTGEYEVKETKWVKIDKLTEFTLKPSELGWTNQNYAYRFTYYATPKNKETFSSAVVNNKFTLSRNVVKGESSIDISEIYSQKKVTVSGDFKMNLRKEAWYYEEPKADASTWQNGKIYWMIEVDGTAILKNTSFRDAISNGTGLQNSYLHSDSLVGIYKGMLPEGNTITGYKNLQEMQTSSGLQDIKDQFTDSELTNEKKFPGSGNYSELTVKAKDTIFLDGEKLYFIVQSEPQSLPVNYRDCFTYKNQIQTSDDGTKWIDQGSADKSLYSGADILKELGQTFTYDGTTVTSNQDGKDKDDRYNKASDKIAASELKKTTGPGQYAAWVFKLNYAGELSGSYQVLEQIPDGMELAYIRIKWFGDKQNGNYIQSKEISGLDGWTKKTTDSLATDNSGISVVTTYYVKGNQALIELGDFIAGKERDNYSVDVQVVCRVTDPKVLLGGENKTFTNHVTLQTIEGEEISTATSPATIKPQKIGKTFDSDQQNITFTIEANQLGEALPTVEGTKLKLIDKLSSTLELDITTIKVVNKNNGEAVTFTPSIRDDNTLEIEIPHNVPVKITYTATINAPPGQNVDFSNVVYWEKYSPSSGTNVEKKDYSYTAGGTVSSGSTITLKIIKKDQNNLSASLAGAEFKVVNCTRDSSTGDISEVSETDRKEWTGTTDDNGILELGTVGSSKSVMEYNTIYKVTETKAPAGYVLDQKPIYIMVPKITDGASDYSADVKACINDPQIKKQYKSTYELQVTNHKGEITVEKKFANPGGYVSNPVSGTYKFGLYENADRTNTDGSITPLQKISITYDAGDTTPKSSKFVNLELSKIYYVFELDDKDQPIKDSSTVATVNGMEYLTSYTATKSGSTTEPNSASNGDTVTVTNQSRVNKLPSTGSCGVLIYRLAGAILILFAVVLMLMKYKETKTRN
ncbi:MAG: SpaA isopeptide-forming pilin-related protein [Mediterraneibacter faecis]